MPAWSLTALNTKDEVMPSEPNDATDSPEHARIASHTVESTAVHTPETTNEHDPDLAGYFQPRTAH